MTIPFLEQLPDVLRRLTLLEEAAKRIVAQLSRNVFQRPQVVAGSIWRRNQQEQEVNLLAVEAVEVYPLLADRHGADELVDGRMLRMGHRDSTPDARAAEFLAFEDRG